MIIHNKGKRPASARGGREGRWIAGGTLWHCGHQLPQMHSRLNRYMIIDRGGFDTHSKTPPGRSFRAPNPRGDDDLWEIGGVEGLSK